MFEGVLERPVEEDWPFEPGPGPRWSGYAPDGLLAMLLDHQRGQPGEFEQVERIGGWDKVIAWAQAAQLTEIASFTERRVATAAADAAARAAARAAGEPVGPDIGCCDGPEQAAAELAFMLALSPVTAAHRVAEACELTERHPAALAALAEGALTLTKLRILAEQTAQLPPAQAGAVTERVLPRAGRQTPAQLRASVRPRTTGRDDIPDPGDPPRCATRSSPRNPNAGIPAAAAPPPPPAAVIGVLPVFGTPTSPAARSTGRPYSSSVGQSSSRRRASPSRTSNVVGE